MLHLLAEVHAHLSSRGTSSALIGAGAMTVAGYVRSTLDLDLFVLDPSPLDASYWQGLSREHEVEISDSRLERDDPLLGLVRLHSRDGLQVDVVVGRHPRWQRPILDRAEPTQLGAGAPIPVVRPADLVLLKLFAGSIFDDRDILELLRLLPGIEAEVEALIADMPPAELERWRRLTSRV